MRRENAHATAVVLGRACLLIMGPSGSGKTTLGLFLLDAFARDGRFAAFVADDQVWLRNASGRLVAEAPEAIAGLAERRGFGPAPVIFVPHAVVDGVVHLVGEGAAARFAEPRSETLAGVSVPRIDLARHGLPATAGAVRAWLDHLGRG